MRIFFALYVFRLFGFVSVKEKIKAADIIINEIETPVSIMLSVNEQRKKLRWNEKKSFTENGWRKPRNPGFGLGFEPPCNFSKTPIFMQYTWEKESQNHLKDPKNTD